MGSRGWIWAGLVIASAGLTLGWVPGGGGGLSAADTAAVLKRVTMSVNPQLLDRIQLLAQETWMPAGHTVSNDYETDRVIFYHSVPLEIQLTEDGRALSSEALEKQEKFADLVQRQIDRLSDGQDGRMLNLGSEVWTLDRFVAQYSWSGKQGPVVDGRPTLILDFRPGPPRHASSRMQKVLDQSVGEVEVDAETGQILQGSFHTLAPVKFGGGLLADIQFSGTYTLQPVQVGGEVCWVMKEAVVEVRGRELFHRADGTETLIYTPVTPLH